jgi:hypothetical protein
MEMFALILEDIRTAIESAPLGRMQRIRCGEGRSIPPVQMAAQGSVDTSLKKVHVMAAIEVSDDDYVERR